jgi:hypothetical protein
MSGIDLIKMVLVSNLATALPGSLINDSSAIKTACIPEQNGSCFLYVTGIN